MADDLRRDTNTRMDKSVIALKEVFSKIRTGRAHTSLLDHLRVEYYGNPVPLQQIANVTALDSHTLAVTPWEKSLVQVIEKAILNSGLGLNPATAGTVIRVPLPMLTEQRRRELVKVVRQEAEQARISVRNIRRDSLGKFKERVHEKQITEDDERRESEYIQKLTDGHVAQIEKLLQAKEAELMEV